MGKGDAVTGAWDYRSQPAAKRAGTFVPGCPRNDDHPGPKTLLRAHDRPGAIAFLSGAVPCHQDLNDARPHAGRQGLNGATELVEL